MPGSGDRVVFRLAVILRFRHVPNPTLVTSYASTIRVVEEWVTQPDTIRPAGLTSTEEKKCGITSFKEHNYAAACDQSQCFGRDHQDRSDWDPIPPYWR